MVYWSTAGTLTTVIWVRFPSEIKIFLSVRWRVKVDRISVIDLKVDRISDIHLLAEITVYTNLNITKF
jgi:hypothetical protein